MHDTHSDLTFFQRALGRNLNPVFLSTSIFRSDFPKLLKKVSPLKVGSVDALSIQLCHLQSARIVSWVAACRNSGKPNFQLALHFFDREAPDQSASIAVGRSTVDQSASRSLIVQVEDTLTVFQVFFPSAKCCQDWQQFELKHRVAGFSHEQIHPFITYFFREIFDRRSCWVYKNRSQRTKFVDIPFARTICEDDPSF